MPLKPTTSSKQKLSKTKPEDRIIVSFNHLSKNGIEDAISLTKILKDLISHFRYHGHMHDYYKYANDDQKKEFKNSLKDAETLTDFNLEYVKSQEDADNVINFIKCVNEYTRLSFFSLEGTEKPINHKTDTKILFTCKTKEDIGKIDPKKYDGVLASLVLVEEIRKKFPKIIIVSTTTEKETTSVKEAIQNGADFVIIDYCLPLHKNPRSYIEEVLKQVKNGLQSKPY